MLERQYCLHVLHTRWADWLRCKRQARLFAEAGVTKIRLTGGEPTLRQDIVPLTAALAALPGVRDVGITTNALALRRKLANLQAAGAGGLGSSQGPGQGQGQGLLLCR